MSRPLKHARAPLLLAAAVLSYGLPAAAQSAATVNAQLGTANTARFPLNAQIGLTHSLGSASYVASPPNPTLQSQLSLSPTARLAPGWLLGLDQRFGFEWTRSDSTTTVNQVELSDFGVRLTYTGFAWNDVGLRLAITGGYNLPISMASRQAGSTGAMALGTRLMWNGVAGFNGYAGTRVGVNPLVSALAERFHGRPGKPYVDRLGRTINTVACNPRSDEELGGFVCLDGGFPSAFTWSLAGGVGYTPPILDESLFIGLDLTFAQGFSPYVPCTEGKDNLGYDCAELKADNARDFIPRQSTQVNLSVSWSPTTWVIVTGGVFTGQPLFASDSTSLRVPLVDGFLCIADGDPTTPGDYCPAANNNGSLYLDTTFMF